MLNAKAAAYARPTTQVALNEFAEAVLEGLSANTKSLPARFFYDANGSALFEEITKLPEYYPTRTETAILSTHARDMVADIPDDSVLIEFGSGSSRKTEILLATLPRLRAYIPIDVSIDALEVAKRRLVTGFPGLDIRPIHGDFSGPIEIPADLRSYARTGFFPGSTIGNLLPSEAARLLSEMRAALSTDGRLIIGVDLKKDPHTLVLAYNDTAGVTAQFNLNMLARINREIEPAFNLHNFRHEAVYNAGEGRIEMHLVSLKAQSVALLGQRFYFQAGESIHTENSYKYAIDEFQTLCKSAGWQSKRIWTDPEKLFSVHELVVANR